MVLLKKGYTSASLRPELVAEKLMAGTNCFCSTYGDKMVAREENAGPMILWGKKVSRVI
jgi:hypothetical protein